MINKKTILFALLVCIYSCGKKEPSNITPEPTYEYNSNSEQVSDPTIEQTEIADNETITTAQKLATLDSDSPETIQFDDYRVLEIQKHLYRLSKAFNETEESIGNTTHSTSILLKKEKGLNYSNLELLRVADKDLDEIKDSGVKYAEFMALLAMMTEE
mgnify:FL=1|jgi:hypothetical protein